MKTRRCKVLWFSEDRLFDLITPILEHKEKMFLPPPLNLEGVTVERTFHDPSRNMWAMLLHHPKWEEIPQSQSFPSIYEENTLSSMQLAPRMQSPFQMKILREGAKPFARAKDGDAGFDIWSVQGGIIEPGASLNFLTGIATSYPSNWVGLVLDRSGMGWKGIMRQAGVIDSNWRGEWGVRLYNTSRYPMAIQSVIEYPEAKAMAQVVFVPCFDGDFDLVTDLPDSARGSQWKGSSDKCS